MTNKHFVQAATAPKQPFRTVYFEKVGRRYKPAAADFSFLPDVRLPGFYLFHVNGHGYSYSRVEADTDVVKKATQRALAERICALLVDHDRPEPDEPIPSKALKAMNDVMEQYPVLRGKRWRGRSFMDLATDIAIGLLNDKN
jgi:hypothetical protein